jgi:hypothetical protein
VPVLAPALVRVAPAPARVVADSVISWL